jgi:hypothetical protein
MMSQNKIGYDKTISPAAHWYHNDHNPPYFLTKLFMDAF